MYLCDIARSSSPPLELYPELVEKVPQPYSGLDLGISDRNSDWLFKKTTWKQFIVDCESLYYLETVKMSPPFSIQSSGSRTLSGLNLEYVLLVHFNMFSTDQSWVTGLTTWCLLLSSSLPLPTPGKPLQPGEHWARNRVNWRKIIHLYSTSRLYKP